MYNSPRNRKINNASALSHSWLPTIFNGLYTEYAMCYLNYNILKLLLYFEIMTGKLTMDVKE